MNLLFLCTGNSCRSQMAEGWAKALLPGVTVDSAGIESHGMNPRAVQTMREAGVDITTQSSNVVTEDQIASADIVVTVCGHADEHCPVLPAGTRRIHWPLPDPAKLTGDEETIMAGFREVCDDIRQRVESLRDSLS